MGRGAPHSHFPRGAHVFIIMRNGEKFEDVFESNENHGEVRLRKRGWIRVSKIRAMSYRRLNTGEPKSQGYHSK